MKSLRIRVSGRVQGVFFRASAKDEADRLGVCGLVRNEPDGSVYIEAEGEEEAMDRFVAWCRKGPKRAVVGNVNVQEIPPGNFAGFSVNTGW